jgi:hypothetical protein
MADEVLEAWVGAERVESGIHFQRKRFSVEQIVAIVKQVYAFHAELPAISSMGHK